MGLEPTVATPLADPVAEGVRIVQTARERRLAVYLLGGVAIAARQPEGVAPLLLRRFNDIDVIATREAAREITTLLHELGYEADQEFNVVNGRSRMLFRDVAHERDLDVLIGEFVMCHELPVLDEAVPERLTIPLADLLLTKLQIVELNQKDLWDVYNLLHAHDIVDGDGGAGAPDAIDGGRIAALCARDWGLWRTVTQSLATLREPEHEAVLADAVRDTVRGRAAALESAIEGAKKSRRWTLRSRVGDRVRWYEEPEEAH